MKKILSLLVALILSLTPCVSYAWDIDVLVDDARVTFDVPPVIDNGRTLVPVRAIFEALGATVSWDSAVNTVISSLNGTSITITPGSNVMYVNGNAKYLDVPARVTDGRTLVPARAVSEAFGCMVSWNEVQSIVHISGGIALSRTGAGEYSGSPYIAVNGNVPYFNIDHYTPDSFEMYLPLDKHQRCTYAMAMLGRETLPLGARDSIASVEPSGWQSITYDAVPGKYLYNRCHLIGYQLSGENANECNLFTGTRYLNTEGMLPFENMIADYIKETGNHVLYRVTPFFEGDNLLANGVLMEAMSLEDRGEGISFNVFCYNVQPGITIDYADGTSSLNDTDATLYPDNTNALYILNISTGKFHLPSCSSAGRISPRNRKDSTSSKEELIAGGYSPCGLCKP